MAVNQNVVNLMPLIRQKALKYGIDPQTFAGLVDFESGGNAKARNGSSGATGLGQVMPKEAGRMFRDRPTSEELLDPEVNLEWAAKIFAAGLKQYGSEDKALAAYLGAIDGRGNITNARDANGTDGPAYIRNVRQRAESYGDAVTQSGRQPSPQSQAAVRRVASRVAAFNGTYTMPVDGTLTTPFGGAQTYSAGKTTNIGNFNNGVDLAAKAGTPVHAPVGGKVIAVYNSAHDDRKGERDAEENSGYGGSIVIQGDDGKEHRLSHAQYGSILVKKGDRVEQGQVTHNTGMTGNATGPHVDWEVKEGGKNIDPLKAPHQTAAQGATNVADPPSNPNQPVIDEYERQLQQAELDIRNIQNQLPTLRGNISKALSAPEGSALAGQTSDLQKSLVQLEKDLTAAQTNRGKIALGLADAKRVDPAKSQTADQQEAVRLANEQTKLENEALQKKLDNGGLTPLEETRLRQDIANNNSIIRARDAALPGQLEAQRLGNQATVATTQRTVQTAAQEAESFAPTLDALYIANGISQENLDYLKANNPTLLATASLKLSQALKLAPSEIRSGEAEAGLAEQRLADAKAASQPIIDNLRSSGRLTTIQAVTAEQELPGKLVAQGLENRLTNAQTEQATATTERTKVGTHYDTLIANAEELRQASERAIEQAIRDNPNMSSQQMAEIILGHATTMKDRLDAWRTQLETQTAQSEQTLKTQQNQISQQNADANQQQGAWTAAIGEENARTNQVNAFSATAAPSGSSRRMARLFAAGPLGGEQGMDALAAGTRIGASEVNAAKAGYQQFKSMLDGIRNSAGPVRRAPDVQAPSPIDIRFQPPTIPSSAPLPSVAMTPPNAPPPVAALAPTSDPFAFTPPVVSEEDLRRQRANSMRVSSGRGGV